MPSLWQRIANIKIKLTFPLLAENSGSGSCRVDVEVRSAAVKFYSC